MKPTFFKQPKDFRKWLDKNHDKETELLVGFYKVSSGKPSITWPQSVDEALCFGWIDGVRKNIDEESYSIRFTPRKATSIWSAINIKKMEVLTQQGLVRPEGLAAFALRKENKSRVYSFESEPVKLRADFEKQFKASKDAWKFFHAQAPSYIRAALHWVMTAKQEATRVKRLAELIAVSAEGRKPKHLSYDKRPG